MPHNQTKWLLVKKTCESDYGTDVNPMSIDYGGIGAALNFFVRSSQEQADQLSTMRPVEDWRREGHFNVSRWTMDFVDWNRSLESRSEVNIYGTPWWPTTQSFLN